MKSINYETLNQVQGDKIVVTTQPPRGEGVGEGSVDGWGLSIVLIKIVAGFFVIF